MKQKYFEQDHKGLFNEIFVEAQKKLKATFGFQVKELNEGGKKCYVLLNLMNEENVDPVKLVLIETLYALVYLLAEVLF